MAFSANTAINQLAQASNGQARLSAMIGAKYFSQHNNSVMFRFMRGAKNKANHLTITLDPSDTYTMKFVKIHGMNSKTVEEISGVYNDQLKEIFEDRTSLYLSI